jgi:nucleotide-binding universal stress UspA family protein
LAVDVGSIAAKICDRARWTDLIVVRLAYPPAPQPVAKLSSGFHTLVRRCNSPVLVVPRNFVYPLDRALLAYDGSPKAKEALYIAAYLAGRWTIPLVVITVTEKGGSAGPLEEARAYLQTRGVEATFISDRGLVAETVVNAAERHDSNLIIMGGYGYHAVLEVVLGSAVDEVLRTSRRPVLICR